MDIQKNVWGGNYRGKVRRKPIEKDVLGIF